MTSVTDTHGNIATYAYDSAGNLWSITISSGQGMLENRAPAPAALAAAAEVGAANLNPAAALTASILSGAGRVVARRLTVRGERAGSRLSKTPHPERARNLIRLAASANDRGAGK